MRPPKKIIIQVVLSVGFAVLVSLVWFMCTGIVALALDTDNPPQSLEIAYKVLTSPARYLPGWESWDSRYSTMSFGQWCLYSNIGDILNALLWGASFACIFFVLLRGFSSRQANTNHECVT